MRDVRFGLVLDQDEAAALKLLAVQEQATAASVVRKLIWQASRALAGITGTSNGRPEPAMATRDENEPGEGCPR